MAISHTEDDRGLALRVGGGDQSAFEDLYRRYRYPLFDFALRTTHDTEVAAGAVQATFAKAWDGLRHGSTPKHVQAWLFTLGRTATIDAIRHRSSLADDTGHGEAVDFARVDADRLSDPQPVVRDQELIDLVWAAATGLGPSDYMLLDMNLRQALTPEDMADALGVRRGSMYVTLAQLKNRLEETVCYTLLLRRGRKECAALDGVLAGSDPENIDANSRRLIDRHVAECEACSERQLRYPSPAAVFGALTVLPMATRVEHSIWTGVSDHQQRSDLVSPGLERLRQAPVRRVAAVAVIALLLLFGVTRFTSRGETVHDPSDVHSTNHQLNQGSDSNVINISWSPDPDAQAYATKWSQQPRDVPDAVAVLAGSATATASPPLQDGTWYFHLRTQGRGGHWTSTVHLGPFVISSPPPSPTPEPPTPTVAAAAAPASTAPEASPTAPPEPPATATPPRPTATATRPAASTSASASAAAKPTIPPASASAAAKPAASATAVPTARPSTPPSAAASASAPACPGFGGASLVATSAPGNKVSLNWGSSGGCGPFKGSITARYQQDTGPFASYGVTSPSGSITDAPPLRCQGSYTVVYSLGIQDASGQGASASTTTAVVWQC